MAASTTKMHFEAQLEMQEWRGRDFGSAKGYQQTELRTAYFKDARLASRDCIPSVDEHQLRRK